MKRKIASRGILLAVILAITLVWIGAAKAVEDFPSTGTLEAYGVGNEVEIVSASCDALVAKIPTPANQPVVNPDWQIRCSHAIWNGEKWDLEGKDEYAVKTEKFDNNYVKATVVPLKTENGLDWLVCWGSNSNAGKGDTCLADDRNCLWINQKSKYARLDKKGKPHYEFGHNCKKGKVVPVSSTLPVRP